MPDPLQYFGITPPGSPLSAFFPQPDEDFRARLEERAPQRSRLPPEYAVAGMLPDPQGFLDQVQKMRGSNQARDLIKGLDTLDFGSKDYPSQLSKLISKYPLGAENSAARNVLNLKSLSGRQAQDKNLNATAAQAMKDFYSLDPGDPQYAEKHEKWVQGLDPEVLADTRVDHLIQTGFNNAATQRAKRTAQDQEKTILQKEARRLGIPASKYDNLDALNDAIADRMDKGNQQKELRDFLRTPGSPAKEYGAALTQLRSPTSGSEWDQEKAEAVGKQPKDMSEADWQTGHHLALQKRINNVRAISNQIQLQTGINPMMGYEEPAPVAAQAAIPAQVPTKLPADLPPEGAPVAPEQSPENFQPVGAPAPTIPSATGFAGLQQKMTATSAAKAAEQAAIAQKHEQLIPQWEKAKNEIASFIDPLALKAAIPLSPRNLAKAAGHHPDDVAFHDENGRPVTWHKVAQATISDPRIKGGSVTAPILQTPTGRKFTAGAPIQAP